MSLSKRDLYWLEMCSFGAGSGMYAGARVEDVPAKIAKRLHQGSLIRISIPNNPAHKERWVATEEGRAALSHPQRNEVTK